VHQEINASADQPTVWAVVRSGQEPVVVNLPELDPIARPSDGRAVPEREQR
jgi:uncharacterized RmlC-like cupin family protein